MSETSSSPDQNSFASLAPLVNRLEELRISAAAKLRRHIFLFVPIAIAAFALTYFLKPKLPLVWLFFPSAMVGVIGVLTVPKDVAAYRLRFKELLVKAVVQRFSNQLHYLPRGGLSQSDLMSTGLFSITPNRFHSEDLVKGVYNDVNIGFSEIRAKRVETRGSGKNRRTETTIVFNGVLFLAQFNKKFKTTTIVLPDTAEKAFGKLGQSLQSVFSGFMGGNQVSGLNLIRLDDPEFEKAYVVYGQDQIEARYILTPSLMQRLLAVGKRFGGRVAISFRDSTIAIAITTHHNQFEAPLAGKIDAAAVGALIQSVASYLAIVDELRLNERLWATA